VLPSPKRRWSGASEWACPAYVIFERDRLAEEWVVGVDGEEKWDGLF